MSSCNSLHSPLHNSAFLDCTKQFGYISWQDFLIQLKKLKVTDPYHQVIINDVIALLTRKGFEDFTNMNIEVPQPINIEQYFLFNIESKLEISFQIDISVR